MADVERRLHYALWLWRQNVNAKDPLVEAFEKSVKDFEQDMSSCKPTPTRPSPCTSSI